MSSNGNSSDLNANNENLLSYMNLKELEDLFKKSSNSYSKLKEKDLVLVIGNTGSGKSTVINYLLGNKMKAEFHKGKKVIVGMSQDEINYPKIGLSNLSETLYPMVYEDLFNNLIYCDCPGFGENRGVSEEICGEISIEIAIKLANSIKAILIIINANELDAKRGECLSQLNHRLLKLFKNFDEIIQSIFFVFTKVDDNDITSEHLIQQIEQKIDDQVSLSSKKSQSMWSLSEISDRNSVVEKYMNMLKLMIANSKNFFIINYCNDNSRIEIIDRISQLSESIKESDFEFESNNDLHLRFNKFIFNISHEGTSLIDNRNELKKFIQHSKNELKRLNERIEFYKSELNILNAESVSEKKIENSSNFEYSGEFKMIISKIKSNEAHKEAERTRLEPIINEMTQIERDLARLSSNEVILYWKDSVLEKRLKMNIFGQTICFGRTNKIFSYKDIEYERVEYYKENGTFEVKEDNKIQGRFKAVYVSNAKDDGVAWVKIYVKKKNKPDVKYSIIRTQMRLQKKKLEKRNIEHVISKLDAENNQYQTILKNLNLTLLCNGDVQAQKNSIENEIQNCTSCIKIINGEIVMAVNKLQDCEEQLESKKELFEMVSLISYKMPFSSILVEEFLNLKYDFLDNNTKVNINYDLPDDYICPIRQEIMDDPVTTPCCHTFDKIGIINCFRMSKRVINCPICRSPIEEKDLKSNINLKSIIETWKQREHNDMANKLFGSISKLFYDSKSEITESELFERKSKLDDEVTRVELQLQHLKIEQKKVDELIQKLNNNNKTNEIF